MRNLFVSIPMSFRMMRQPYCTILLAHGLLAVVVGRMAAQDFETQAVLAAWKTLATKAGAVRSESIGERFSSIDGGAPKLTGKEIIKASCSADGIMFSYESESYRGKVIERIETLELANRQYRATLQKAKFKAWLLGKLEDGPEETEKVTKKGHMIAFPWLVCSTVAHGYLPTWMGDPSFVVGRTESIKGVDGATRIRAQFFCDGSKRQSELVPKSLESGFIEFEPGHAYCIRAFELQLNGQVVRGAYEYDTSAQVPVLTSGSQEAERKASGKGSGAYKIIHKTSYKLEYNAPVKEEEYRLSHFGLPEPKGVVWRSPIHWYLWFIGAAIPCLAAGAFFRYRARKRQKSA